MTPYNANSGVCDVNPGGYPSPLLNQGESRPQSPVLVDVLFARQIGHQNANSGGLFA